MTRGIRNNNPGNIRRSGSRWLGAAILHTDKEFVQFTSMDYGLRAMMVLLRNYIKDGYDTPKKIISRYAPSTENNTDAYLRAVCASDDFDVVISPFSDSFFSLVSEMCFYESNYAVSVRRLHQIAKVFHLCR